MLPAEDGHTKPFQLGRRKAIRAPEFGHSILVRHFEPHEVVARHSDCSPKARFQRVPECGSGCHLSTGAYPKNDQIRIAGFPQPARY